MKIRASQINGCARCLDLHLRQSQSLGEDVRRLVALSAWRDSPLFTERERAALAWAEAVTRIAEKGVPEAVWQEARRWFSERELVELTMAVITINAWNRLNVAFRVLPDP
ncbi:MAG: carboxymuconolactone decarboxylase family protein [Armatimonadota bacterium]|nr:carboxymuconolactone decarboxylase family protein [Armatimonadota bacterium]MDR7440303.1 carboxymuconolactone decarboxylase family protein [Armatimonadota bacterium]MDR7564013.1 carboxymuconolactone decarboxylase family protein [Armatimonadota bacterium]MDR7568353.1 carboxymuconolactone decarboxylase family protein [Armatimonadota bacterium]MDR7602595.1 carboxymuconolactone decarboxylase family protein [Armatimonadota bacterium]